MVFTRRTAAWGLLAPLLLVLGVTAGDRNAVEPRTRTYYLAADELDWDYAPSGRNRIHDAPFEGLETMLMEPGPKQIGRIYRKALFREYTDSTFTTLKPRPPDWEHLGALGPMIRGQVGDTIRVVFRNNGSYPYSVHPHGVLYAKDSEGAPSADGTSGRDKADDAVPPGGTHVYVWPVPERAGPPPGGASSTIWMYHSHANETRDVNAGLIGPLVVTARGQAREDATPIDVDRELVAAFAEYDENGSWFFDENLNGSATEPETVTEEEKTTFSSLFFNLNLRETVNGFSFGHTPGLTMRVGERVRWYVFSSTNFEMHAPHWHGNVVIANHMRTDVLSLLPMEMLVADMVPDNPGTWLFHCHVGPHLNAGMQAQFTVLP